MTRSMTEPTWPGRRDAGTTEADGSGATRIVLAAPPAARLDAMPAYALEMGPGYDRPSPGGVAPDIDGFAADAFAFSSTTGG